MRVNFIRQPGITDPANLASMYFSLIFNSAISLKPRRNLQRIAVDSCGTFTSRRNRTIRYVYIVTAHIATVKITTAEGFVSSPLDDSIGVNCSSGTRLEKEGVLREEGENAAGGRLRHDCNSNSRFFYSSRRGLRGTLKPMLMPMCSFLRGGRRTLFKSTRNYSVIVVFLAPRQS